MFVPWPAFAQAPTTTAAAHAARLRLRTTVVRICRPSFCRFATGDLRDATRRSRRARAHARRIERLRSTDRRKRCQPDVDRSIDARTVVRRAEVEHEAA